MISLITLCLRLLEISFVIPIRSLEHERFFKYLVCPCSFHKCAYVQPLSLKTQVNVNDFNCMSFRRVCRKATGNTSKCMAFVQFHLSRSSANIRAGTQLSLKPGAMPRLRRAHHGQANQSEPTESPCELPGDRLYGLGKQRKKGKNFTKKLLPS